MGKKIILFSFVCVCIMACIFCSYALSDAYTMNISMSDDQGGTLNISYDFDTTNIVPGVISMTAQCCFSSYHPYLEGAVIDGCLNMIYSTDSTGSSFTLTVNGGPVTYRFGGVGYYQVSYDNFTIIFSGLSYSISGAVIVNGIPYDLSGWGGDPLWLFF